MNSPSPVIPIVPAVGEQSSLAGGGVGGKGGLNARLPAQNLAKLSVG
jgi:hypothetical protein